MTGNQCHGPFYPLTLGQMVRNKRRLSGLTQSDLAYDGLSRNEVSLVERDHVSGIRLSTLAHIAGILGLDMGLMVRAWQESGRQAAMKGM